MRIALLLVMMTLGCASPFPSGQMRQCAVICREQTVEFFADHGVECRCNLKR